MCVCRCACVLFRVHRCVGVVCLTVYLSVRLFVCLGGFPAITPGVAAQGAYMSLCGFSQGFVSRHVSRCGFCSVNIFVGVCVCVCFLLLGLRACVCVVWCGFCCVNMHACALVLLWHWRARVFVPLGLGAKGPSAWWHVRGLPGAKFACGKCGGTMFHVAAPCLEGPVVERGRFERMHVSFMENVAVASCFRGPWVWWHVREWRGCKSAVWKMSWRRHVSTFLLCGGMRVSCEDASQLYGTCDGGVRVPRVPKCGGMWVGCEDASHAALWKRAASCCEGPAMWWHFAELR